VLDAGSCYVACLDVARSVCVIVTWVSCAKMTEPVKVPFQGQINYVDPRNHYYM